MVFSEDSLDKALAGMILSASGWRGIFAQGGVSPDVPDEESRTGTISAAHEIIAAAAAEVFAARLRENAPAAGAPLVIVGTDTRPTGPAIAEAVITALLGAGCAVRYTAVTAAPEIMAYARSLGDQNSGAAGFIYISASHNPIGHNGLKFGLTDGGVISAGEASVLIEKFRSLLAKPDRVAHINDLLGKAVPEAVKKVYAESAAVKKEAYTAYLNFTAQVVYGGVMGHSIAAALSRGIGERPLGIAADFNGSARTLSIDKEFFDSLGIKFHTMNDKPGEISHRIVPEGESLEPCRLFLEKLHREDPSVILGYVPDCDGDRGNLVIWDEGEGRARSLEAQEVFALACVAELAHLVWTGELGYDAAGNARNKAAVAVNDPTSLRIDRIARAFDVSVFRSEVGEANVVGLARRLREKGYTVRILGEGSAGGSIIHPSAVRDPINTVLALLKLFAVRSEGGKPGLFELWCDLSGQGELYRSDFTLQDIIAALPAFVTTGAYAGEALLKIKTADHALLKSRYQAVFLEEWEKRKDELKVKYGITGWEAAAYRGLEEIRPLTRFGDAGRGGLKINFCNENGVPMASIWMRGSATEPVFRIMADACGPDRRLERDLIEWQRRMVAEADGAGCTNYEGTKE
ncbi:phosphoglucomutase [Spirochaetia bacterium]|nr:phosphoglucomutase [Spirochaetia bacterium]